MGNIFFKKKTLFLCGLILITFNILVFLPSLKGDFVFDDIHLVRNSPITQNPSFLKNFLWQAFGDPLEKDRNGKETANGTRFYRPVIAFSFWLDYKLWGLNAAGFHLTNLLIHSFNVILLFLLLTRFLNNLLSAFGSACLFSVFPTNFENVAWISGRTDMLAFFFLLVSAHFFLSFIKTGVARYLLLAAFSFLLALLSKETVILSLLVFAYLFYFYGKKPNRLSWVSFILSFSIVLIAFFVLRSKVVGIPAMNLFILPLGAFFSGLGFYLLHAAFPFFLGFSIPDEKILYSLAYFYVGLVFCLSFFAVGGYFLFKRKPLPADLLWGGLSFIMLLPSLLILFFENQISILAWRFLYIPLAVAISLFATFLFRILRPLFYCLLVSALVLLYGVELLPHVRHYGQSDREFWLNLHHLERENRIFRLNHAAILLPVNERKAVGMLELLVQDKSSFQSDFFRRRALEIGAFYFTSVNHLQQAKFYFSTLFSEYEGQPLNVYFQYAYFLAKSGNMERGREIILHYLRLFPENHEVLLKAADFYLLIRDFSRALHLLQEDFRLFPTNSVQQRIRKLQLNQSTD
jgi:hypothetical protein